ncbi:MAG: sigma-70 family RNA polymerase sigma factor [Ruminococcaceae bacterium]|nr:sigma-70 family RNA polymerase sigma factor [Oscillospiraceae bacterium]
MPDSFVLEDELCTKETLEEIGKFVLSKPPDTQKIFTLFYLHDLTISDIADLLCTSESFVKNRLYRTLREIKKEYGGEKE